jgi:hypothetical protein
MDIRGVCVWHDAELDPPPECLAGERVLVYIERNAWPDGCDEPVRKREVDIGWHVDGRWHVDGVGKGLRVLFWMPLPKPPKTGDHVILKTAYANPEWEGDPANGYWKVCGECRGTIPDTAETCPHCGCRIDWTGWVGSGGAYR